MTYVDPPIGDPPETVMIVSVPVELFVAKEIVVPFCPGDATKTAATMTTAVATTTADVIAATFCLGDTRSILAATR